MSIFKNGVVAAGIFFGFVVMIGIELMYSSTVTRIESRLWSGETIETKVRSEARQQAAYENSLDGCIHRLCQTSRHWAGWPGQGW